MGVAVAALLVPAPAMADTVTITPPAEPVATVEASVSVQVSTERTDSRLVVLTRPAADGPCGANYFEDPGDSRDKAYISEKPRPPDPIRSGTYEFRHAWADTRPHRICAWIQSYDVASAADSKDVTARAPRGTMKVTRIRPEAVRQNGSYLTARFSGTIEGTAELSGTVVRAGKRCPADPADGRVPISVYDGQVDGTFTRPGATTRPLPFGHWRVCAYASHHLGTTTAAANATHRPRIKPILLRKPDIGADPNTRWIKCLPGDWAAYPKRIRFSFQWYRSGRKIRGARKQRFKHRRPGYYTCAVTARNRVGSKTARSYGHNVLY